VDIVIGVLVILLLGAGYAVILWIGLSPLEQWSRLYWRERLRNRQWPYRWWAYPMFWRVLSDGKPERNFTRRELIQSLVLLLFALGALAFHLIFSV
jgi:hypothetical protein